jgi:hypothetical protein
MSAEESARDTFEETWADGGADEAPLELASPPRASGGDQGPCLYLGPGGQRCDRRAIEGGYCAKHRPGSISLPKPAFSKKTLAAIIGLAGILWPYLADLVREFVRWTHSH